MSSIRKSPSTITKMNCTSRWTSGSISRCPSQRLKAFFGRKSPSTIAIMNSISRCSSRCPSRCAIQERKISPKRKFWPGYPCGHPAKNFGRALQKILEKKQAFWDGHPARTSMKKLRSEKLRADFSFPRVWIDDFTRSIGIEFFQSQGQKNFGLNVRSLS